MAKLLKKKKKIYVFVLVVILIILGTVGWFLLRPDSNTVVHKWEIPEDWKKFSATDSDFGVQTTISLPPECNFTFSGSEWDLGCGKNDKWDYTTSVYRGNDENISKNHYARQPLREWYQQYINKDIILSMTEYSLSMKDYPLYNREYFEVQVKLADTGKTETNYLFIWNHILHIVRPLEIDEATSQVKKNIGIIFASLDSFDLSIPEEGKICGEYRDYYACKEGYRCAITDINILDTGGRCRKSE